MGNTSGASSKNNGSVRLCEDFKVTVNPGLVVDTYLLPTIDDLQEKMNGKTTGLDVEEIPEPQYGKQ